MQEECLFLDAVAMEEFIVTCHFYISFSKKMRTKQPHWEVKHTIVHSNLLGSANGEIFYLHMLATCWRIFPFLGSIVTDPDAWKRRPLFQKKLK